MPSPKCILFNANPTPIDEQVQGLISAIPFASNRIDCDRRKNNSLERMCHKSL